MVDDYGLMPGRYPAIVRSYNQAKRTCRVEIPGLTDGGDVLPEAEIEYPIGDKSAHGSYPTEIEILPGDPVWIAFVGGDPRYPIITGYRNPQTGNSVDWRRWHHANMELLAGTLMKLMSGGDFLAQSGTLLTIRAPQVVIDAETTTLKGDIKIEGAGGGASTTITGNVSVTGNIAATGTIIDAGGNTNHHSH